MESCVCAESKVEQITDDINTILVIIFIEKIKLKIKDISLLNLITLLYYFKEFFQLLLSVSVFFMIESFCTFNVGFV